MKRDFRNLVALGGIQGSNALAPLFIFPYALSRLGSMGYAELVQSEALSQLILAIVIFSFDVNGVSRLVHLRETGTKAQIDHLFSSILYIRIMLFITVLIFAIALNAAMGRSVVAIILWSLVPLSYIFQSIWLFQGLERNLPAAIFAMLSRVTCVLLIIVVVKGPADKILIPATMGLTYLAGALTSFWYAITYCGLRITKVSSHDLINSLNDGREIFLGNVSVALYRDLNVLILGFAGVDATGIAAYSIAEKLTKSLQAVARPLNQLFFPKVIRRIHAAVEPNWSVATTIMRQTLLQLAGLAFVILLLGLAYFIVRTYTSYMSRFPNIGLVTAFLSIMVPSVFLGVMNYMFGTVGLNQLNNRNFLFRAILAVGVTSAATCFLLARHIGAFAGVFSFTGAELALLLIIVARYSDNPGILRNLFRAVKR